MNMTQAFEEQDYSEAARFDRFDGFDRGDLDYDHDAEQQARNEEAEAEYQRDLAAAAAAGCTYEEYIECEVDRMIAAEEQANRQLSA